MRMRNGFIAAEWTVCPSRNLLSRGEEEVRVEPRVMDVLVMLADRAGDVVSKEDLIAQVWPDRHVTDDVLTVTIYALRKALGDEARRPRFVETVSRRGYRWIAPVEPIQQPAPPSLPTPTDAPATPTGEAPTHALPQAPQPQTAPAQTRTARWRFGIAAAALAIVLIAAVAWLKTPRPRHTPLPEAHAAYLKGRYFLDQRSLNGWKPALEQFQRAVSLDPNDPAAQAGLADAYSLMWDFGVVSREETQPKALQAAQQALALDPESAEGLAALGRVRFLFDWEFDAAERNLTRAIARDPDYMPAYQSLAWVLSARGQHDAAVSAGRRALQLDPANTQRYNELAWVLSLKGQHAEALREIDRALQLNPRSLESNMARGWTCEMAGRPDEAFAAYTNALRLMGLPDSVLQQLGAIYRAEGLPGYYRHWLDSRGVSNVPMSETLRATLYARIGQTDRALASLQRAYDRREGALAWVNVEPSFAALHTDARFQQIAAHIPRRN
jgi:DNA-binding winged helix-turn-helix (wHTH) protein/tetratricopeptide (TPR) repeat protein